jgi:hypothetical protein
MILSASGDFFLDGVLLKTSAFPLRAQLRDVLSGALPK